MVFFGVVLRYAQHRQKALAARMAMIAMTTSNSMSVKARGCDLRNERMKVS